MEKYYFGNENATICYPLSWHIENCNPDETELNLVEAIPDKDNPDYIFCSLEGSVGERSYCKKSECNGYESKSGRGICSKRGKLFQHGETVNIKLTTAHNRA